MFKKLRTMPAKMRLKNSRFVLGVAGVLGAAIIGSAGVAAAQTAPQTGYLPNEASCAQLWKPYGFKNRGACESYYNKHKHDPHPGHGGHGYGGGGNTTGVTVTINGNNNVVTIIINYF